MKKPDTTNITEAAATKEVFRILLKIKSPTIKLKDLQDKILKIFIEKYGGYNQENLDYFNYIFGHAKKNLKRENILSSYSKDDSSEIMNIQYKDPEPFEPIKTENIKWKQSSISQIYEFISNDKYLIPSFQRATAWNKQKDYIELAYSIYKSVPLGIIYIWDIGKEKVMDIGHKYIKREVNSNDGLENFDDVRKNELGNDKKYYSIIDGQQRITGINLIINGKHDGKKLYFNEKKPESKKFAFKKSDDLFWNSMEDIYSKLKKIFDNSKDKNITEIYSEIEKLTDELYISFDSLKAFYNGFFMSDLISKCTLPDSNLEDIMQVFIRTNDFGKTLKPTDIMLSSLVADNQFIRDKIADLHSLLKTYKKNFPLSTVLKLVSIIFTGHAKVNHKQFRKLNNDLITKKGHDFNVETDENWDKLYKSIEEMKKILNSGKLEPKLIKSANSLIPIIYWIFAINKKLPITSQTAIKNIRSYLIITQIANAFGSSTDNQLDKIISWINEDKNPSFNWKIKVNPNASIEKVKDVISNYKYGINNPEILALLNMFDNRFDDSNSIEHLIPQSKNGSDEIFNLAALPTTINSSINAKSLKEKVKTLAEKYEISEKTVIKKLLLTREDIETNKINRKIRMKKLYEEIGKRFSN